MDPRFEFKSWSPTTGHWDGTKDWNRYLFGLLVCKVVSLCLLFTCFVYSWRLVYILISYLRTCLRILKLKDPELREWTFYPCHYQGWGVPTVFLIYSIGPISYTHRVQLFTNRVETTLRRQICFGTSFSPSIRFVSPGVNIRVTTPSGSTPPANLGPQILIGPVVSLWSINVS